MPNTSISMVLVEFDLNKMNEGVSHTLSLMKLILEAF